MNSTLVDQFLVHDLPDWRVAHGETPNPEPEPLRAEIRRSRNAAEFVVGTDAEFEAMRRDGGALVAPRRVRMETDGPEVRLFVSCRVSSNSEALVLLGPEGVAAMPAQGGRALLFLRGEGGMEVADAVDDGAGAMAWLRERVGLPRFPADAPTDIEIKAYHGAIAVTAGSAAETAAYGNPDAPEEAAWPRAIDAEADGGGFKLILTCQNGSDSSALCLMGPKGLLFENAAGVGAAIFYDGEPGFQVVRGYDHSKDALNSARQRIGLPAEPLCLELEAPSLV